MRNIIDPISLNDIDNSNEWLIGEMGANTSDAEDDLVFDDDNLTWVMWQGHLGLEKI